MSQQLKVRFAQKEEAGQVVEWLNSTPGNLYDTDILGYPSLRVLCAYNGVGPVVYLPSQTCLVLESTAIRPGTSELQSAAAFRDLLKAYQLVCSSLGIKEMMFFSTDEKMLALAESHGFEPIEGQCVRMKL